MSKSYTNSCGSDPLDPLCFCYARGASNRYKIYDVDTASYLCCGRIQFDISNSGNTILSAAENDDPRCVGWWYGSAQNFPSQTSQPLPVVDFFFPDAGTLQGSMPVSYGPSNEDLAAVTRQAGLANYFAPPTSNVTANLGTTVSCASDETLYWLKYINPNMGVNFAETMVCLKNDQMSVLVSSSVYTQGNWALYSPVCQSSSANTCTSLTNNTLGRPLTTTVGNKVLSTPSYTGGNNLPFPVTPASSSNTWIVVMVIILLIVVIAIAIILYFTLRPKNKTENDRKKD